MTDYELVSILNEAMTQVADTFMNFITVLFAFLIAVYFVATKLTRMQAYVVGLLYSLFSSMMFWAIVAFFQTILGVQRILFERSMQPRSEVGAVLNLNSMTTYGVMAAALGILLLAYAAGIAYFISQRRHRHAA